MTPLRTEVIDCGIATATAPGQRESGDRFVIRTVGDGVLVAVLDGVGHGEAAAAAAQTAAQILRESHDPSVIAMVRTCHQALRMTRGVVMSLAMFDPQDDTVTWLGVGNVAGRLLRLDSTGDARDEYLLLRAGVVGHTLPPLRAEILAIAPGDLVVLSTDGIDPDFARSIRRSEGSQPSADRILAVHYKGADDAVVLVMRYLGGLREPRG